VSSRRRGTIVVGGSLAQQPGVGGHTWVFLQYLLGFRRLGWDVLFLDRLEPEMCVGPDGSPTSLEASENLRYLRATLARFGLGDAFALLYDAGRQVIGRSRTELVEQVRRSTMLINVMGFITDEEVLGASARRIFLDIDPGFAQMWRELGLADLFTGHDAFVTIGEHIGRADCPIPTCGLDWIGTRQPVVLEHWPVQAADGDAFTSVASWRGPFAPVEYQGRTYGLRVHEFRRFVALPRLAGRRFEVALDIHPDEVSDLTLLADNGWHLVEPLRVAGDPERYRAYVQHSRAELTVAKQMYVETRSGWFSDRSVCYLASGRPVVAQDTGLHDLYPLGKGLLAFRSLEEAQAAVEEVERDYARHALRARAVAEEYFDSDRVLARLLQTLGA
jgi:hypothetical protein